MSDLAIRVENLSKQYKIGVEKYRHDTLRDKVAEGVKSFFCRNGYPTSVRGGVSVEHLSDTIWALRDVSFEIRQGEVVGLIGRNGAGKSTFLKVLSRITEPTRGRAEIYGRIGSLLEVGTGFHPELTGRENIYLNGAILGMRKAEIEQKFDEIVAFAEVEKFIDTPVKRYSSGMYVRLAFAVAAHLDPEILLVDEVLAVGDAAFQEKCLGRMRRSASSGKTVLFVSHNMPSVQHLCTRAILLDHGQISAEGLPAQVIRSYLSDVPHESSVSIRDWHDRTSSGEAQIVRLEISDDCGRVTNSIPIGGGVRFSIIAEFYKPLVDPCFGVIVHNAAGEAILDLRSNHAGLRLGRVKGTVIVHAAVEKLGLYPGRYFLSPWITDSNYTHAVDWVKLCCTLEVYPAPGLYGDLKLEPEYGKYWVASVWMANAS
jgi:lipopolysaccharide transport system ATP-binding protein